MSNSLKSDVTVIIPCYNDGLYITQAIDSVLHQTVLPEKIIIVDDGSQQETKDILKSLDNPLIQLVFQNNQGVAIARNNAIELAETRHILSLDADDHFEPTFIEKALIILQKDKETAAVCCFYQKHRSNKFIEDVIEPLGGGVTNFLVKNNGIASGMFRRSCWKKVGGYDTNFKNGYEDWEFWISILKNNGKMHIIPEVLFYYRIKNTSRDQVAVAQFDVELRKAIYRKHQDLYLVNSEKVYLQMINQNNKLRNSIVNMQKSKDYRLGSFLLKPLRFVKNLWS
ncbi:glycosyltransferase family 2 protein [Nonlabens sp. MB-3u-79]|uniref:glycosyltransferase family 2 protein n=1 Tax=Nonlabens sp. MB-3u-79 TaxID=2058134 RepID=UPI000C3001EF|nr:glycosyltransferase family A protein [Nonlabens sp. MB-3u-79]AUC77992.1 glycosyltransferase family 2 protein [Nonlabens sp. MB-3u-79]